MNGIYDFENHYTPYLDMEMLMKRQAQKRKKKILILSGIATILMAMVTIVVLHLVASIDKELFKIVYIGFSVYIMTGTIVIGRFIKKGDYIWQE